MGLLATACSKANDASPGGSTTLGKPKEAVFRLGISEPTSIDPYNSKDSESQVVTKNIFEGLLTLDSKTKAVKPGVAESFTKTDDCITWTFKLRKSSFSNGEAVTADSFIRGMTRAAKQKAASDIASFMSSIDGYKAIHGDVKSDGTVITPATADTFSGLSAPDPQTLVVKNASADCEFDKKVVQPVFLPVPSVAGDPGDKTYGDAPIGNGQFKLQGKWEHDKSITLVPNDSYYGDKPKLTRIEFTVEKVEDEYRGFQAGTRDFARIPPELVPQAKAAYEKDGQLITQVTNGLNYLTVSNNNGVMKNADARSAVSYAIDRQAVIDGVFKGLQTKADSMIPPSFPLYYTKGICSSCTFDVTKAKELAAKGGLKPGTKIQFTYNEDGGHKPWVEAIAAQLKTNLGLVVDIQPVPKFKDELAKLKDPAFVGLGRTGWSADFPSPVNFLYPLLGSDSGDNYGKFNNPKYDALIKQALAAKTDADRAPIVKQAEQLAMDQQGLIPLWYRTQYRAVNAKAFTGIGLDFFENPTFSTIAPV